MKGDGRPLTPAFGALPPRKDLFAGVLAFFAVERAHLLMLRTLPGKQPITEIRATICDFSIWWGRCAPRPGVRSVSCVGALLCMRRRTRQPGCCGNRRCRRIISPSFMGATSG